MPRDSAAADRPASYLVGTAAAFPLFFRDRTKPINQLPFSPSAKFPKSESSCESRVNQNSIIELLHAEPFADDSKRKNGHARFSRAFERWDFRLAGEARTHETGMRFTRR